MEYYKNKLKNKIDIYFKSKGLKNDIVLKDSLFKGISSGKYEIIWDIKQKNVLKLEPIDGEVRIEFGIYHIKNNIFGKNHKHLYPSQYIEFDISEERDEKIKSVFKTMKTILITGGAGYIGTHTVVELLKDESYTSSSTNIIRKPTISVL